MNGFWKDKRILVTGATGFLGGWLINALVDEGALVFGVVRNRLRPCQLFKTDLQNKVTILDGAVEDSGVVAAAFGLAQPDAVFHLASMVDVNLAVEFPEKLFDSSLTSTLHILERVRRHSQNTALVVASSDKAYGAQATPFREDAPLLPRSPYEIAKASQDLMAQFYGAQLGLKTAVTRCANFYGGWDFNFNRIIPYAMREALAGRAPALRSDGHSTRDFLYVEDAAAANLLLAQRLMEGKVTSGQAFNFSHEVGVEIGALATSICRRINPSITPVITATERQSIRDMRLDCSKAKKLLNWSPRHTFEQGMDETIAWYQTRKDLAVTQ